jgi:ribonuclease PH
MQNEQLRADGRPPHALRPIHFETGFTAWAEGSVLARFGQTHVLCNVTVEETLPPWLQNRPDPQGWLTAEYAMLPRSTHTRSRREQRWPKGRTQEISRLIGRSLRMALNLDQLGPRTLTVDCDVLQADGGTRTAAISGGWVAVQLAAAAGGGRNHPCRRFPPPNRRDQRRHRCRSPAPRPPLS